MIKEIARSIIDSVHDEYDGSDEWQTDITAPNITLENGMRDAICDAVNGMDFATSDETARAVVADGIISGVINEDAIRVASRANTGDQTLVCYLATAAILSECYELARCEPEE